MVAVVLEVDQVVEHVDATRRKGRKRRRRRRVRPATATPRSGASQQRQEDEQVLDPLVQAQRTQPGAQAGGRLLELALDRSDCGAAARRTPRARRHRHGAPRLLPRPAHRRGSCRRSRSRARQSARTRASALRCDDRLVTPSLAMTSWNRPRWSATWLDELGVRCRAQHDACGRSRARRVSSPAARRGTAAWRCRVDAVRDPALQLRLAYEEPERQPPRQRTARCRPGSARILARGRCAGACRRGRSRAAAHPKRRTRCDRAGGNGSHRADESATSLARWAPSRRLSEIDRSSG